MMRVRGRYRMAKTLRGFGRMSRLATGPRLDGGTRLNFLISAHRTRSRVILPWA
jgi:hypothetical protein